MEADLPLHWRLEYSNSNLGWKDVRVVGPRGDLLAIMQSKATDKEDPFVCVS